MKKSNRLSVRVLALLMTFMMLFSFSATVFAAQGDVVSTKYYTIGYNSDTDVPEIVVTVAADELGALLAGRNFTKEELKNFLPEFIVEVLTTRTMPALSDLVEFIPDKMLIKSEIAKIVPVELVKKYLDQDLVDAAKAATADGVDLDKVLGAITSDALRAEIKSILMKVILNDVDSVDLLYHDSIDQAATIFSYNPTALSLEMHLQEMSDAILLSVPDTHDLMTIGDGDTLFMMGLGMNFAGDSDTYGCKVRVELEGDTSVLNGYADKLAQVLNYRIDAYSGDVEYGLSVDVSDFSDDAFISFADLLRKALTTDRLTDSQKAELFTIFSKEGQELIDAIVALDLNASWINAEYVPYLEQIRDKMLLVLERAMDASSTDYSTVSLADLYDDFWLQFILEDQFSIPTANLIEMLCTKVGFSVEDLKSVIGSYDDYVSYKVNFTFGMDEVYRVSYHDANGDVIYTTFLPMGTDLSVINNNTDELNGKAGKYGWADKEGNIVTVTPDYSHLDLYPANEIEPDTYLATFVADGKVVAKIPFKAGDKKLSKVPMVPEKIGYHGRWENYKLADKDITIKAIYTEKTYTVIYNANGGEGTMANQVFTYDKAATLRPCGFTRDGYTFTGWSTNPNGGGAFYVDQQLVKNLTIVDGVILYAQWEVVAPTVHTVTFMANGVVVDKVTFNEGDKELSRIPEVPARVGYTGAWEEFTLANADITVNAEYTANEYTVVFDANGGEGAIIPNQTMTYDTFAKLTANTYTNDGHKFAGWNTKADGTGDSYADGENVKNLAESGEVTLYAQWDEVVTETTTVETTTAPVEEEGGFNWLVLVGVLAVLAVAGGVGGYLVYKKKSV